MIYLDHTATTKPYDEVVSLFQNELATNFFNASAMYKVGIEMEKVVQKSLQSLATNLDCKPTELIVTSGATESINTAIKGSFFQHKKTAKTILISKAEHKATKKACEFLKQFGVETITINLTKHGQMDLEDLKEKLMIYQPFMLSFLSVNNEIGAINPVDQIVLIAKELSPNTLIHVDHVQAWNKIPISLSNGIHFASFSSHKIHGIKGMGLLFVKHNTMFTPLIEGGSQQNGKRSGTIYPTGIKAMALASKIGHTKIEQHHLYVKELRDYLLEQLDHQNINYIEHAKETALPQILSLGFKQVKGETLLHMLEQDEIYVSTKAACSSSKKYPNDTLVAMGVSKEIIDGTIRISIDPSNTREEMDQVAMSIKKAVTQLQKIYRK